MKHILQFFTLIFLVLNSCSNNNRQEESSAKNIQNDTANKLVTKNVISLLNNDTLIVDKRAAIFVLADSSRIEKRKKEIGEENFQIGLDDYAFYINSAQEFLNGVKMTILSTKGKKFVKFMYANKVPQVINLDKLSELWSIYFFDPSKKARQVDMISIDEEYKNYFQNR